MLCIRWLRLTSVWNSTPKTCFHFIERKPERCDKISAKVNSCPSGLIHASRSLLQRAIRGDQVYFFLLQYRLMSCGLSVREKVIDRKRTFCFIWKQVLSFSQWFLTLAKWKSFTKVMLKDDVTHMKQRTVKKWFFHRLSNIHASSFKALLYSTRKWLADEDLLLKMPVSKEC